MLRLQHPAFRFHQSPDTKWTVKDKPILILDGALHRIKSLSQTLAGNAAYVVGVGDRELPMLASFLQVEYLYFYEMRAVDLSPLSAIPHLQNLKIEWNSKVSVLDAIGRLRGLETLILIDVPKVKDISPLEELSELNAFEYSGGIGNSNHAVSLQPIALLPKLEELALFNLRVQSGGLRPLGQCRSLRTLAVSNQFDTEDYAYLSAALPHVHCESFAPWVRVNLSDGRDTMITGRRKPFLNSKLDAAKIAEYEEVFRRLQRQFVASFSGRNQINS